MGAQSTSPPLPVIRVSFVRQSVISPTNSEKEKMREWFKFPFFPCHAQFSKKPISYNGSKVKLLAFSINGCLCFAHQISNSILMPK
jgi:hypothetical protein